MGSFRTFPLSIKFISVVLGLRIIAFVVIAVGSCIFLMDFQSDTTLAGIKEGALSALGASPNSYNSYEAGRIIGRFSFFAILAGLALYFLMKRKTLALRIMLGLIILTSVGLGGFATFISILLFAVSFTKSSRAFLLGSP